MLVLLLILLVSGVSVASAAVITAGGAATMALSALDQGLPDVKAFRDLDFNEQSTMFARDGKTRLAQFWDDRRSVIEDFDNIPKVVLDATTATEDKTFWNNPGVDLQATIAQVLATAGGGEARGASTITQQLVRAVLLPEDVLANQTTTEGIYERKVKEIIQSFKLTQALPGETGKQEVIKAYLNQIPYGGAVHGIKAAASAYLGKSIGQLTLAEAAFLAAIPQEPRQPLPVQDKSQEREVRQHRAGKVRQEEQEDRQAEDALRGPPVWRQARLHGHGCGQAPAVPAQPAARRVWTLDPADGGAGRGRQGAEDRHPATEGGEVQGAPVREQGAGQRSSRSWAMTTIQ